VRREGVEDGRTAHPLALAQVPRGAALRRCVCAAAAVVDRGSLQVKLRLEARNESQTQLPAQAAIPRPCN
jgi:hypothetical protein